MTARAARGGVVFWFFCRGAARGDREAQRAIKEYVNVF